MQWYDSFILENPFYQKQQCMNAECRESGVTGEYLEMKCLLKELLAIVTSMAAMKTMFSKQE